MAYNYSRSSSDTDDDYRSSPINNRPVYSPPPRRRAYVSGDSWETSEPRCSPPPSRHRPRSKNNLGSDTNRTFGGRVGKSQYRSPSSERRRFLGRAREHVRPGSGSTYNWKESDDDYTSEAETTSSLVPEPPSTFQDVESEGLSKTFIVPRSQIDQHPPMNFTANAGSIGWNQPQASFEDGSISNLFVVHASEYSLNKDGKQKIRLTCPNHPPPKDPNPSLVQFRWLHLQTQILRLDHFDKLVINSPYISSQLKTVSLQVLSEVKNRTSRKLVGGTGLKLGSIFRGVSRHDDGDYLEDRPVIFLSSPHVMLDQRPPLSDTDEERHVFSLLESLYGYDVESDRQEAGMVERMNLDSSKSTLQVPQLWCLLVGNDVLITLSTLPVEDLGKDLVEIDQKTSLRRPLTIRVKTHYNRPYSVVIDADCNYADFVKHTFALDEEVRTNMTNYELRDEDDELVTPQMWLTMIKERTVENTVFYIIPKFSHQRESGESRSRSRSRVRRLRRQETNPVSPLALTRGRRPYLKKSFESRTSVNDIDREADLQNAFWITQDRTISPELRSDYGDPNKWALVKYGHSPARNNVDDFGESSAGNITGRKLVTWKDQGDEQEDQGTENDGVQKVKGKNRALDTPRNEPYAAENIQVIARGKSEDPTRAPSVVRIHRRNSSGHSLSSRKSLSRFRTKTFPGDRFRLQRAHSYRSSASNPDRAYSRKGRRVIEHDPPLHHRRQRSQSRTRGPDIIVNDTSYETQKPKLLSLGDLVNHQQNYDLSSVSSDIESDHSESNGSLSATTDSYDTGGSWERRKPPDDQRQGRSASPAESEKTYHSSEGLLKSSSTYSSDAANQGFIKGQYPKKGRTRIPAKFVSIQAVIDLGYPYAVEGDIVVLHRALNQSLIDQLLRVSEEYKTTGASIAESTYTSSEPEITSPSSTIKLLPFFHWRVDMKNDDDLADTDVILVQMLGTVDRQLCSDKLYNTTYACTLDDLLHRHAGLLAKIVPPRESDIHVNQLSSENAQKNYQNNEDRLDDSAVTDTTSKHENGNRRTTEDLHNEISNDQAENISVPDAFSKSEQSSSTQKRNLEPIATNSRFQSGSIVLPELDNAEVDIERDSRLKSSFEVDNETGGIEQEKEESIRLVSLDEVAMKDLLQLSQELLDTFLPKESSASLHRVYRRFWGSVDEMFRHIKWSAVDGTGKTEWTIQDFTSNAALSKSLSRSSTNKKTFGDCSSCTDRVVYSSCVEALEHLHSEHISCTNSSKSKQPFDDPCFVWLRRFKESQAQKSLNEIIMTVNLFVRSLTNVKDLAMELQYLVATTSRQDTEPELRPFLPSNVFYAFQEILYMYLNTSKQLFIINRLREVRSSVENQQIGSLRRKINFFGSCVQDSFLRARELLENSKGDLLLSGTTAGSQGALGIVSVGPQFLVAALTANVQNMPILPDTDVDAVQAYHGYISKLRYEANRRPRRRVFLDIHRLQEDLEALQNIVSAQIKVLDNFQRLLSPASYRVTDSSRQGLFPTESRYIDLQASRLRDRNEEIRVQRERAKFLMEQIKQTIEILEEGHGKAIRVFTIVTVFFLPLSFISSFFGMNTTDIRDTNYDQSFFWAVGIPVTTVVLGLAFLYGYKGDEIEDGILALTTTGSQRSQREPPKKTATWGTLGSAEINATRDTSRHRLHSWLRARKKVK